MENREFTISELLGRALAETENVWVEEEFVVRDLFKGYVWARIPVGIRIQLGSQFYAKLPKNIVPTRKTSQHQQMYKRIA